MTRQFSIKAALLSGAVLTATPALAAEVTFERLVNADKEPHNWLMNHRTYDGQRFSPLAAITRDNVRNLRLVWALALGGMQDIGQNGPENEINPLIDNGFMYTTDGWGTVYKIDARQGNKG